jgi:hypothetical protein
MESVMNSNKRHWWIMNGLQMGAVDFLFQELPKGLGPVIEAAILNSYLSLTS